MVPGWAMLNLVSYTIRFIVFVILMFISYKAFLKELPEIGEFFDNIPLPTFIEINPIAERSGFVITKDGTVIPIDPERLDQASFEEDAAACVWGLRIAEDPCKIEKEIKNVSYEKDVPAWAVRWVSFSIEIVIFELFVLIIGVILYRFPYGLAFWLNSCARLFSVVASAGAPVFWFQYNSYVEQTLMSVFNSPQHVEIQSNETGFYLFIGLSMAFVVFDILQIFVGFYLRKISLSK